MCMDESKLQVCMGYYDLHAYDYTPWKTHRCCVRLSSSYVKLPPSYTHIHVYSLYECDMKLSFVTQHKCCVWPAVTWTSWRWLIHLYAISDRTHLHATHHNTSAQCGPLQLVCHGIHWLIHILHASFIRDTTYSCVWYDSFTTHSCAWHDSFKCDTTQVLSVNYCS